jgi:dTDP-4-amino-4,6-dideoxygalactose transaminase
MISDPRHLERAEVLRQKGTNRARFLCGQVDKYTWVDVGSSFLPSDLLAALLLAQLEMAEQVQGRRRQIWDAYAAELAGWAEEQGVRLPGVPAHCQPSYHLFYLILPSPQDRQALIAHLGDRGIHSAFHYQPLHLSDMGRRFGGRECLCPVTESVSDRLVRLPFYYDLDEADQARVIAATRSFSVSRSDRLRDENNPPGGRYAA